MKEKEPETQSEKSEIEEILDESDTENEKETTVASEDTGVADVADVADDGDDDGDGDDAEESNDDDDDDDENVEDENETSEKSKSQSQSRRSTPMKRGTDQPTETERTINGDQGDKIDRWNIHLTHPDEMDPSPRPLQNHRLFEQLRHFELLTDEVDRKYSLAKHYQMLRTISTINLFTDANANLPHQHHQPQRIGSMYQLKKLLQQMKKKQITFKDDAAAAAAAAANDMHHYRHKENIEKLLQDFFLFMNDHRKLKLIFDERIFAVLYEYYSNPAELINAPTERAVSPIMHQLNELNEKWARLLDETAPDENLFSAESYGDVLPYLEHSRFHPMLRLLPDLMRKIRRSIDLARQWCFMTAKRPPPMNLKDQEKRRTEIREALHQLEDAKVHVEEYIRSVDEELERSSQEVQALSKREHRVFKVQQNIEQNESMQKELEANIERLQDEKFEAEQRLTRISHLDPEHKACLKRIAQCTRSTALLKRQLHLIQFRQRVLREDRNVEVELQAEILRISTDANVRLRSLEKEMELQQELRSKLDKEISLVRVNQKRIDTLRKKNKTAGDAGQSRKNPADVGQSRRNPVDGGRQGRRNPADGGQRGKNPSDVSPSRKNLSDPGQSRKHPAEAGQTRK